MQRLSTNLSFSLSLSQVLWGNVWLGPGVCLPVTYTHDLPEAAGGAALALCPFSQSPHPAGSGQSSGPVLHVDLP